MGFRAAVGAAEGGGRHRDLVPIRPDGCPPTAWPGKASCPDQQVSLRRVERLGPGRLVGRRVAAGKTAAAHELRAVSEGVVGDRRGKPLASPCVLPRVGWLSHLTVAQASPAATRETLPVRRTKRRWPGRRGQAPRPLGRQPHRRRGRTGRPVILGDGGALPAPPAFRPTRTPRRPAIVALRRSYGPYRLPETPPSSPGVASEPVVQVKVRSRCPLSGPRGTLPSRS